MLLIRVIRPVTADPSDLQANPTSSNCTALYFTVVACFYHDTLVSGHGNISSSGLIRQREREGWGGWGVEDMDGNYISIEKSPF